ncbi:MAG: hypothetical protein PVF58_03820 [Candidatus Methanofastidiosia archaeon]|jgi:DNA-binding transcriptional ArsR family regulator
MVKRKHELEKKIEKALEDAPKIKGLTVKQLAETTETPWSTTRWHLELMEARGVVEFIEIGRAKLYALTRKTKDSSK